MLPNNSNLSTFVLYTAAVVLVGGVLLPLWWQYDFLAQLLRHLIQTEGREDGFPSKVFSVHELKQYDGSQGNLIYLAILGRVYDVTKGKKHYGKGGSYSFFAGRDATRAFVTGDFEENGLTDDLTGLSNDKYLGIDDWVQMYEKDYKFVGVLTGRFYNSDGSKTEEHKRYQKEVEMAKRLKEKDSNEKREFPECNSQWTPETGVVVWCSTESGGIKRSWEGVPRRFYKPGQASFRCACVRKGLLDDGRISKYPGCSEKAVTCRLGD